MKNKLYLLLITVMACFALSACGDSDEGTKEMETYEPYLLQQYGYEERD